MFSERQKVEVFLFSFLILIVMQNKLSNTDFTPTLHFLACNITNWYVFLQQGMGLMEKYV